MNVSFDEIFSEVMENMNHFTPKEKDYSKLTKYKEVLNGLVDDVVSEIFDDIFSCESTKNMFKIEDREKLEAEFKEWICSFFEISNKDELNEFYKNVVKKGIKYVEKDFSPEHLSAILITIGDALNSKLKEKLNEEEFSEIVEILDDLLKRIALLNVASYMNFESKALEYIGVNQNLKKNAVKLGIKKMGL
jgi:predicted house-cleaning noncanonical NTP pyrophosphatase (MazG superfamily)